MDPITIIVSALVIGAASGLQETANMAIKDTYSMLKELILSKLRPIPDGEMILSKHEENPTVWENPLRDVIVKASLDRDNEILEIAKSIISDASKDPKISSKFDLSIHGKVQGLIQGDHGTMTLNINGVDKGTE